MQTVRISEQWKEERVEDNVRATGCFYEACLLLHIAGA